MKPITRIAATILTIATLVSCAVTVLICTYASNSTPKLVESATTPDAVVNAYFNHICAREFDEADKLLSSKVTTLSETPDSAVGTLLYDALWENFSFTCPVPPVMTSLSATQTVRVTYLDIPAVTALQRTHMRSELEKLAEGSEDPDALLDEEGYYNTEISLQALENVTALLLEDPSRFLVTKDLTLELEYINYEWKIIANEALYQVLSGNTY